MEKAVNATSISQATSIAEMAEFWDSHDAADYDDRTFEVVMEFDLQGQGHYIAIAPDLVAPLREEAKARGIGVESLANLWLQEKVLAAHA